VLDNYVWAALVETLSRREKICAVSSMWATGRLYVGTTTKNERKKMKVVEKYEELYKKALAENNTRLAFEIALAIADVERNEQK